MESLLINNTICLLALVLLSGCGGPSEEKHVTNEQREQPHRNRLAAEKSLYLRQHAGNPVDWYPWGDEAFARAKKEEKPIFLSIGYSACHWCHVMERESFENPAIAALLNKDYVCIKVDREERPDIDNVYMTAVQLMTHHGGWPLTVFLTPDLKPFAGGTYFPPDHLKEILARVVEVWKKEKEMIVRESGTITEAVRSVLAEQGGDRFDVSGKWFERALETYKSRYDATNGGFGRAPKFPPAMDLMLMLRVHRRGSVDDVLPMVEKTLERMACGGMFDHLGGGFHRYSTDERWLVPHFEKMLYDQAMISRAYLEAYQATGKPFYADVARATFDYVLRDMTSPKGGFYASEDADSEGEEGRFYVWTRKEIEENLTPDEAKAFIDRYGVTERGNFEADANILATATVAGEACNVAKRKLLERRSRRPRPARDEKILTSWNGMMISSLAIGSRLLDDDRYLRAAAVAARYLLATHVDAKGRLLRMSVDGVAKVGGFLEDYAHFAAALIDLYEADGDPAWLRSAVRMVDEALRLFPRGEGKGYPQVGNDVRVTLVNPIDMGDGVVPSGTSTLIWSMIRLSTLMGKDNLRKEAEQAVRAASADLERNGVAFAMLMCAVDATIGPSVEIVVVGAKDDPRMREMVRAAWRRFIPSRAFALYDGTYPAATLSVVHILEGRMTIGDAPVAYVCVGNACGEPCRDLASFDRQLSEASHR